MIVKQLDDLLGTEAEVRGAAFESRRILLAADGLGYSLHDTVVKPGSVQELEYRNHVESNYCIAGSGTVENVATGEVFDLRPGTLYTLDRHERHIIRAGDEGLRFVCIFTPALTGREVHDENGSYGLPD
ncbi:ectoine synthase [Marimonas arenosa]|uniref:L-ectoine synthase n=1 Tax=Marimonas arenosa TaxID=1795305 RepID=A0AAE4B6C0_9RHOB|nr:ectoine synthase [Marimonas arenosa]MDQ2090216.1 ectoine synthase [Marimonas arenosa]